MPSDHGVWPHDDQSGAPVPPTLGEEDPNSRSVERRCGRVAVRRRAVNCWGSARFSSAIAWCPQQISPIERRSTISAVSMRDSLVDLIRASIDATAAQVFGEGQCARRMRTVRAKWPRVDRLKLVVCSFPEGPRVHQHCEFILFVRRILTCSGLGIRD